MKNVKSLDDKIKKAQVHANAKTKKFNNMIDNVQITNKKINEWKNKLEVIKSSTKLIE